jgi:hypothetical protein
MAPEARRQLLLAALVVILGLVMYRVWTRSQGADQAGPGPAGARRPAAGRAEDKAPDVQLESLQAERPEPDGATRNLFTFGRAPERPAVERPATAPPPRPATPAPPAVPPIPLKFIGVMTVPGQSRRIAVLRDERGVYHGGEGDTIEGRYKILRIGDESIEMSYLDDRGRQTIRLSGS